MSHQGKTLHYDILLVYLDGIQFAQTHVIVALSIDPKGNKHVLGLREGPGENAAVVKDPLTDLVARGLAPARQMIRRVTLPGGRDPETRIETKTETPAMHTTRSPRLRVV